MTPEQRRELERLIRDRVDVAIDRAAHYAVTRQHPDRTRLTETMVALEEFLDEVTDYSAAEAVSRCEHRDSLYGRCADCGMPWAAQARQMGVVS